ncbi:MAG: 8-oxo-dGTP diphosphatase [Algoriphagus sp.]|jgi:8-oxo-dGTP diphosphatase
MTFSPKKAQIPVTCILLFHQGKILAAQRSSQMDLPLLWEFPGGKVEKGESEKACILREIKEELGIEIEVLERVGEFDYVYSEEKSIRLIPFLAVWKSREIILLEHVQISWIGKSDLNTIDWAPADLPIVEYLERNWEEYQKKLLNYPIKN